MNAEIVSRLESSFATTTASHDEVEAMFERAMANAFKRLIETGGVPVRLLDLSEAAIDEFAKAAAEVEGNTAEG